MKFSHIVKPLFDKNRDGEMCCKWLKSNGCVMQQRWQQDTGRKQASK